MRPGRDKGSLKADSPLTWPIANALGQASAAIAHGSDGMIMIDQNFNPVLPAAAYCLICDQQIVEADLNTAFVVKVKNELTAHARACCQACSRQGDEEILLDEIVRRRME
jgi:hypothetical protein